MTEEDAKTKWCPFANAHGDSFMRSVDRAGLRADGWQHTLCIASACMAWRRSVVMIDRMTGEPAVPGVAALGDLEPRYNAHGFCGLAGAPQ